MPGRMKYHRFRMDRAALLSELARRISGVKRPHPVRVAVDGPDASGKSMLADELAGALRSGPRPVIRASLDSFHNPRDIRYRRGADSPEGYYQDSFDYDALKLLLLVPLGPGGNRVCRTSAFYFRTDSPAPSPPLQAPPDSILLFDGVFLLRAELINFWEYKIFVHADSEVLLRRAAGRDQMLFGSPEQVEARYRTRYLPGQQLYFEECDPRSLADAVVINNDPRQPELQFPLQCET